MIRRFPLEIENKPQRPRETWGRVILGGLTLLIVLAFLIFAFFPVLNIGR